MDSPEVTAGINPTPIFNHDATILNVDTHAPNAGVKPELHNVGSAPVFNKPLVVLPLVHAALIVNI